MICGRCTHVGVVVAVAFIHRIVLRCMCDIVELIIKATMLVAILAARGAIKWENRQAACCALCRRVFTVGLRGKRRRPVPDCIAPCAASYCDEHTI